MFRPRGTQARPAIGARTLEGCRSIAEKRKQNKGIEEEKKGRKGKAARKLEEGSLGKRERKRIRIKKRIAGGPARRGVAWRVASRRASSWGVKHLKIPVMQNIGKWPSRPGR